MAGSLKYGQATASLVVGKWSAASRKNTLAAALKEWGMLRRTLHAANRCAGGSADRHGAPETPHCASPSCVGVPFTVLAATSVTRVRCGPAAPVGGGAVTCWEPIYPSTG
ncbi:Tn3 family transposase [Streptosporangium roseum]|uniref:Tn3 family transposase n=1 Tax=Streptosporangium roseum TaxID=2001 RepID=UPI0011D2751E